MARIAYISSTFPNFNGCGIGSYAGYLTKALAQEGHDIHVITTDIPEILAQFGGVKIHKIIKNWSIGEVPQLSKIFNQIRPDILHINHPTSIAGKKSRVLVNLLPELNKLLWKLPVVTTIHEFKNVSLLGKIKLIPLIWGSDAVTATNDLYAREIRKFNFDIKRNRVHTVNIGSAFDENLPQSKQVGQRERWGFSQEDKIVGFTGFITPPKGFHNLIEALAPLIHKDPTIKLFALSSWNLSSPQYKKKITQLIENKNISSNVKITGFLDDPTLWAAMDTIDLCVFPFDEPVEERSSAALRQALYKGLPTMVTANSIDYSEFGLSHTKNIWLTPLKNTQSLKEDILKVLNDDKIRGDLSAGALELRPSLSFASVAKSMTGVYSLLLNPPSLGPV